MHKLLYIDSSFIIFWIFCVCFSATQVFLLKLGSFFSTYPNTKTCVVSYLLFRCSVGGLVLQLYIERWRISSVAGMGFTNI
jgi:hypothetical protein